MTWDCFTVSDERKNTDMILLNARQPFARPRKGEGRAAGTGASASSRTCPVSLPRYKPASRLLQMTTCSLGLHLGATPSLFLIYPMAEFPTNLASTTSKSSSLTGSWLPSGHTGVSPPGLSELAVLGPESTAPPPGDSDSWTVRGGTGHLGEAGSRYHVQLQGALCPASPCATVGWGLRAIRHRRPEPDVALAADKALRQGGPRFSLCGLVPSLTGAAPPH
uniref:Uncharacterized protein LOC123617514 n=1 Tax=Camelus bactrianus TaxID=9837 RepID=A0A9W3HIJ1_CAMBA|nr:uncharacterized protein LOC123617514 [Camelus bactrianus]